MDFEGDRGGGIDIAIDLGAEEAPRRRKRHARATSTDRVRAIKWYIAFACYRVIWYAGLGVAVQHRHSLSFSLSFSLSAAPVAASADAGRRAPSRDSVFERPTFRSCVDVPENARFADVARTRAFRSVVHQSPSRRMV